MATSSQTSNERLDSWVMANGREDKALVYHNTYTYVFVLGYVPIVSKMVYGFSVLAYWGSVVAYWDCVVAYLDSVLAFWGSEVADRGSVVAY